MKTTIKNFNVDWMEIKNLCRQTVNMGDSEIEPNSEWKRKLLICRHSPLRAGSIHFHSEEVPYYVMGHIVRHNVGITPYVGTSREDRTGIPREERKQTDLVNFDFVANIEALLNISERRLCTCADKTTIKYWKGVLEAVKEYDEDIAWACVPQCLAHGGCIEPFAHCRYYDNLKELMTDKAKTNIQKRYDFYNSLRR